MGFADALLVYCPRCGSLLSRIAYLVSAGVKDELEDPRAFWGCLECQQVYTKGWELESGCPTIVFVLGWVYQGSQVARKLDLA